MATTEGIGGFLSVSAAAPATYDSTGYAALTWLDVVKGGDIPEYGPAHSVVTFTPLKTGIVDKFHGELNYGSFTLTGALDSSDTGQVALSAARVSKDEISFRETKSDGTVQYFSGKVMSFTSGSSVGSVVPFSAMIEATRATVAGA